MTMPLFDAIAFLLGAAILWIGAFAAVVGAVWIAFRMTWKISRHTWLEWSTFLRLARFYRQQGAVLNAAVRVIEEVERSGMHEPAEVSAAINDLRLLLGMKPRLKARKSAKTEDSPCSN